jgi:chemotaxis protein MotB
MRRVVTIVLIGMLSGLTVVGTGCVPQDKYDQAILANRTLKEQLVRTESELEAAEANRQTLLNDRNALLTQLDEKDRQIDGLAEEIASLTGDYDGLLERVSSLQVGPLPIEVESELTRLAARYPDLVTFDAKLGMLRFASDLTFDSGRATLRPNAASTVREVARVLTSPAARGFEVRVIGHTDNVPISASRDRHPTNMHLSVHRAISVRDALVASGVDPVRLQAAGYGEYRPLVPNRPGGTVENRRVEIFLVPMPEIAVRATTPAAPTPSDTAVVEPDMDEPMK